MFPHISEEKNNLVKTWLFSSSLPEISVLYLFRQGVPKFNVMSQVKAYPSCTLF